MDELLIEIFGQPRSQVRLYNLARGFHAQIVSVQLEGAQALFIMPVSVRNYVFETQGDLVCEDETSHGFRNLTFHWTDDAQARGTGIGKITMTNPDLPDMPLTFEVSTGAAQVHVDDNRCEHCQDLPPASRADMSVMISHMLAHAHFGDTTSLTHWASVL